MSRLDFHPLTVRDVQPEAEDAIVVGLDVPAALQNDFAFQPGQYLTLRQPGAEPRRSYSICAAAGEPLRVGVRRVPGGAFSSWLHATLKPGDVLEAMPPQGRFGAALAEPAPQGRHVLAVAGGSGITPILAIVGSVLAREPRSRVTLLYGNRRLASTMFKEELEDLKNRHLSRLVIHPVFSRETVDSPLHAGRLDADKIARLLRLVGASTVDQAFVCGEQVDAPLAAGRLDAERLATILRLVGGAAAVEQAFVCGPHAMNDDAEAALQAAGIAPARIHVERFGIPPDAADPTPHAARPGDAALARITLVRDGVSRDFDFVEGDASLLDAAGRAGLVVPYSCKSGVCATCRARLLEGQVRMDRQFALEPADIAAGFVLTCQAHPLSERVVVSFDER
jgi:ring-1,2-phenylacetyl-CoA epoxidase subunit PaaE